MREATARKPITTEGEQNGSGLAQLMRSMGSTKGFDPIPPDQYLYFLSEAEPPLQRLLAWMRSKTIRQGHRSPHAVDERGRELRLEHLAAELDWDAGAVRRTWREAEAKGLVRRNGRQLLLAGDVPAKLGEGKANKKVCTDLFPPYILKQINDLAPERKAALVSRYEQQIQLEAKLLTEAVAGVRSIFDQRKDTVLSEFGIRKIREKKRRPQESALVPLLLPVVEGFVQSSRAAPAAGSVQSPADALYTAESGIVQTSPSLLVSEVQRTTERTAAAAAAAASSAPETTAACTIAPHAWPLALSKARGFFPNITTAFVEKIATVARARRPAVSDEELAEALVLKRGQQSEGLWLLTVQDAMEALNDAERAAAQRLEHTERESRESHAEALRQARRLLTDPKLDPRDRALLLDGQPELAEEFGHLK